MYFGGDPWTGSFVGCIDTIIINNIAISETIAKKYAGCDFKNALYLKELFVSPKVSNYYTADDKTEHVNVFFKPAISKSCLKVEIKSK